MLFTFLCLSLISFSQAGITDTNCTNPDGTLSAIALSCDDPAGTKVCETGIVIPTAPLVAGKDTPDRTAICYKIGGVVDEDQKQAMIKLCPKTCGYCCLTPAYNCKNKLIPAVKCETVTRQQCNDPKWRVILATECPAVCGLCDQGGCVDAVIECAKDISICRNIDMQSFVMLNCQKTCGFCSNNSTSTTTMYPGAGGCRDQGMNCASWVKNGFCTSQFYTIQHKMNYCGMSCGLCGGTGVIMGGTGVLMG